MIRPARAALTTTPSVAFQRGAPMARADSRSSLGTRLRTSSAVRVMTGSMMNARATEAEKPEKWWLGSTRMA